MFAFTALPRNRTDWCSCGYWLLLLLPRS